MVVLQLVGVHLRLSGLSSNLTTETSEIYVRAENKAAVFLYCSFVFAEKLIRKTHSLEQTLVAAYAMRLHTE